nr:GGDEF domain-containing protein [Eubacterium sp.]
MFMNGRKNICVILCDVADFYQEQVCRTLTLCAQNKGYNLSYFSFFLCYGIDTKNGRGEANIVNLVPYEKFDGFIICHDTFQNEQAVRRMFECIKERTQAPVITLRRQQEGYPCVVADSQGAISRFVEHFVKVHGCDKIGFMNGPKNHPDAQRRLEDYKQGLINSGLEYDEKLVYYGNFWRDHAKIAVKYFTEELAERPQAIVCANDYMAISLCNEMINHGFMVPDDIGISGFDDILEASINMPPITTVRIPAKDMSELAFETLDKMIQGEPVPEIQKLKADIVIRNSCGCEGMDMTTMMKKRVRQSQEHERMLDLIQNNTYMSVELSDMEDVGEIISHMRLLENEDIHVNSFFLCLGEGAGQYYPKYYSKQEGYPERMKAVASVLNRKEITTKEFATAELLPKEAMQEETMIYYFFPLHHLEQTFGYFAISYEGVYGCEKTFQSWIAIIGNALENLRLKQKTHSLLEELNKLYVHDSLTGLLNRRGFETETKEIYELSRGNKETMVIVSIDMDNLKVVNDRYGHMQGDVALQTISKAIDYATRKEDVCARIGGDEFSIVGIGYDNDDVQVLLQSFNDYLERFNEESGLPYLVGASCGYCIISEEHDISLETARVESDNHLYENKRQKKLMKKDIVIRDED